MNTEDVIEDIIEREGGYVDIAADHGGATHFGITANTLGRWRGMGRQATRAEVQALTRDEAKEIYRALYVKPLEHIPVDEVRAQVIDISVNSGQLTAIRLLQRALGVNDDGIFGPRTKAALLSKSAREVNNKLMVERIKFYGDIVARDVSQAAFIRGWLSRAVSFIT